MNSMNNTDPAVYVGQAMKQNHYLRHRMEKVRTSLVQLVSGAQREIAQIEEAQRIKYTGWSVLLKKDEDGRWFCVGVVDTDDLPEDLPEDFSVALPIPEPDSLPDFAGW